MNAQTLSINRTLLPSTCLDRAYAGRRVGSRETPWRVPLTEDSRLKHMFEINPANIRLLNCLVAGEDLLSTQDWLDRLTLRKDYIALDVPVMCALAFRQAAKMIPERWKLKTSGQTTHIFFDGSLSSRDRDPNKHSFCVYWRMGRLNMDHRPITYMRRKCDFTAVLAAGS